MTDIRAGSLRDRIIIQAREDETGTRGENTGDWETIGTRWAMVESLTGRELEQARQVVSLATHKVTMRKPRDFTMTTQHQIVFRSRTFGVGSVVELGEMHDDLEMLCTERT